MAMRKHDIWCIPLACATPIPASTAKSVHHDPSKRCGYLSANGSSLELNPYVVFVGLGRAPEIRYRQKRRDGSSRVTTSPV